MAQWFIVTFFHCWVSSCFRWIIALLNIILRLIEIFAFELCDISNILRIKGLTQSYL